MNDREMLELAAKAAGLPWDQWVDDGDDSWNPLTDDGDALRLAVKLGIDITFDDIEVYAFPPDGIGGINETFKFNKDPYAVTRRAIVRAAAEIGRTM